MNNEKRFYSTRDLEKLLRCSSRTLSRRRHDLNNPLPAPKIARTGSSNLYCSEEINDYLAREQARTLIQRTITQH